MTMQQFCLRWNNHQPNFISVFSSLLNSESLVDVTLAAEGRHLQAHKVVLSACSSYFQSLFSINPCQHPIVILKDVKFIHLKVMVDFMYYGEVNVSQEQLPHILKTAEMLKIKGLAEMPDSTSLTKSQSSSTERADLLTPGESNWSSDAQRRSLSPSPCPLSPSARRKRLRKSSTGSGSGSTERTSEEHPTETVLPSPGGSTITHIKVDPGFTSDGSISHRNTKQHSSDSELHRDSSQESEGDPPHQITLQIPQQTEGNIIQNMEPSSGDMPGPSTSSGLTQSQLTGLQWAFVEHACPRFAQTLPQSGVNMNPSAMQYSPDEADPTIPECTVNTDHNPSSESPSQPIYHSPCTSPSHISHHHNTMVPLPMKRKRSVNPQADENFVRALDAVRFGGIGFCKAARMYGVNNRTLWLEYKKRGYPINRPSIKNRIKHEFLSSIELQQHPNANENAISEPESPSESHPMMCSPPQPIDLVTAAFSNDFTEEVRPRYDTTVLTAAQINMQGINFS